MIINGNVPEHAWIRVSTETVRQILRKAGVSWQATKTWKASKDPDFVAKKDRILAQRSDHTGAEVGDAARRGHWVYPDIVRSAQENKAGAGPLQRVRAELLRELLMGRRSELDSRVLRLQGVQVSGQLDLDHITAVTGLTLT